MGIQKAITIVISLNKKMKFSIKDLFTFTEEILNGKLHLLWSEKNTIDKL